MGAIISMNAIRTCTDQLVSDRQPGKTIRDDRKSVTVAVQELRSRRVDGTVREITIVAVNT